MTDIVGTLTQPIIALAFLLSGSIVGVIAFIIKQLLKPNKTTTLIIGDILSTLSFTVSFVTLSFIKVKGVIFIYTLLSYSIGFIITYFLTKNLYALISTKIKSIITKRKQKSTP